METLIKWLCFDNKKAISLTQTSRNINMVIKSEEELNLTLLKEIKFVKDLALELKSKQVNKK